MSKIISIDFFLLGLYISLKSASKYLYDFLKIIPHDIIARMSAIRAKIIGITSEMLGPKIVIRISKVPISINTISIPIQASTSENRNAPKFI
jgi:hypothetical protein